MILGIGTDLLDVARMAKELENGDARFRDELFTLGEIAYCDSKRYPARHYAARFAAKEALVKALGRPGAPWSWRDIEVERGAEGLPQLVLKGPVKEVADRRGVRGIFVSLAHTDDLATASVVLEG